MYNDIRPRKYKFFQLTTNEMKNNQLLVRRAHASPLMQEVRVELGGAIKPWKADVTRRCMIISQADKQCEGYALMRGDHAIAARVVGVQGIECNWIYEFAL
jgi:hypothetical protein